MERAEDGGASAEELRTLLGRGRAKKGIFEGDLEEGELEIGQVSAIVSRQQSVAEVMNELVEAMQREEILVKNKFRSSGFGKPDYFRTLLLQKVGCLINL